MKRERFRFDSFFRALADPTRLRLLSLLADSEICVCYFVEVLGESQPKISRHLAYLRKVGLVNARRDGKWIHYSLGTPEDSSAARLLAVTVEELRARPECQRDLATLTSACCATTLPRALRDAPRPSPI